MKRFTSTLKWTDPWFRRLSGSAKMLWYYALDHCDHIGLVELDLELVSHDCGIKCNDKSVAELGDRIQPIGGNRYFIPKFIGFQYGKLSGACRPHEKVIEAINTHGLVLTPNGYRYPARPETKGMDRVSEDTDRVSHTPQVQDKDCTVQEEDKNKKRGTLSELQKFCRNNGLFPRDAEYLWNRWESNGWQNANKPIKDWRATVRAWKAQGYLPSQKQLLQTDVWPEPKHDEPDIDLMALMMENRAKAAAKEAEMSKEPVSTEDSEWS